MALPKGKTLLLTGGMLMALWLSGCGGTPLSQREIVRAVLCDRQNGAYSVCLLLADQDAPEGQIAYRTASGAGETPARAMAAAEETLCGTPYYGLLDLAALPHDCGWADARAIGLLLYEKAQPAPEVSVFVLDDDPARDWAEQAGALYDEWKATEKTCRVHCGLQQIFAQEGGCALPGRRENGYDMVLMGAQGAAVRIGQARQAQLAAVLCGCADRLRAPFADGDAFAAARTRLLCDGAALRLELRELQLQDLTGGSRPEEALQAALIEELQRDFSAVCAAARTAGGDPFHWQFYAYCRNGADVKEKDFTLQISAI